MRRLTVGAATALAMGAVVLGGCSAPKGIDGKIADDWGPIAQPSSFVPEAGVCHASGFSETAYRSGYDPVDCAQQHQTETVYVGAFSGAAAERPAPPRSGSTELRTAFTECDRRAKSYLGNDWRSGRLWLGVTVPSTQGWSGGSRWFRCEVSELSDVENDGDVVDRSASLKGALTTASALRLGCYTYTRTADTDRFAAVACSKPHNAEFVGVTTGADAVYPSTKAAWDRYHGACRSLIAKYAKVPDDSNMQYRTGTVLVPNGAPEWKDGNHGIRCYAWLNQRKLTRSLKGIGSAGLPINYA
jgi:hypothetical protein